MGLGEYEFGDVLRRDDHAVVYAGTQRVSGKPVWIHLLGARPEQLEAAIAQIHEAQRVDHPNLLRILDAGEHEGGIYVVTEHLEGETLDARLQRERRLDPLVAQKIVMRVLAALETAHDAGLVHRDLRPATLWLEASTEQPKVLGLGQVLQPERAPDPASIATPYYLAPEQTTGAKGVGPNSDIWALGAIFYEMLTGRHPFDGPDSAAVIRAIQASDPPLLSEHRPGAPEALVDAIHQAISRDPMRRIPSAKGFRRAILGQGRPSAVSRVSSAQYEPAAPDTRRWMILGGVGLLALIGIVVAFVVTGGEEPPPPDSEPIADVEDPTPPPTTSRPETPRTPTLPAPRPISSSAAFDLVATDDGALLLYSTSAASGRGIEALALSPFGIAGETESLVTSADELPIVEVDARWTPESLEVAWVKAGHENQASVWRRRGDRDPVVREVGTVPQIDSRRGRVAIAGRGVRYRSRRSVCEVPFGRGRRQCRVSAACALNLGLDPRVDPGDELDEDLEEEELPPVGTGLRCATDDDGGDGLVDLLGNRWMEGCTGLRAYTLGEDVLLRGECGGSTSWHLVGESAPAMAGPMADCGSGDLVVGGARFPMDEVEDLAELLDGIPDTARAVWTGEALVVARHDEGEVAVELQRCVDGALVADEED